jgi:hypothetical protein
MRNLTGRDVLAQPRGVAGARSNLFGPETVNQHDYYFVRVS